MRIKYYSQLTLLFFSFSIYLEHKNPALIKIMIWPKNWHKLRKNIKMSNQHVLLYKLVIFHFSFSEMCANTNFPDLDIQLAIHQAIHFENMHLLEILFEVHIRTYKNNPNQLKLLNSNYINDVYWYGELITPLFFAAKN